MYDVSMAMPLLIRMPGVAKPGTQSDALCMNIDFAETMLDAAGVDVPDAMQGHSLMPLLKGEKPADWREEVFYAYWARPAHYGIRTHRYKLIHTPQSDGWELLDLKTDPDEMQNQFANPEYKNVLDDMKKRLNKLVIQTQLDPANLPPNDPFPRKHRGK
jgi:arylsulfatase A-like enzyme